MQRLEVGGAVRPLYESLGFKGLKTRWTRVAQSVIAPDYGLDGPGSNPGGDEIFRPSRLALGPTEPPVKWVPCLCRGVKCGRGVLLTTHPVLLP